MACKITDESGNRSLYVARNALADLVLGRTGDLKYDRGDGSDRVKGIVVPLAAEDVVEGNDGKALILDWNVGKPKVKITVCISVDEETGELILSTPDGVERLRLSTSALTASVDVLPADAGLDVGSSGVPFTEGHFDTLYEDGEALEDTYQPIGEVLHLEFDASDVYGAAGSETVQDLSGGRRDATNHNATFDATGGPRGRGAVVLDTSQYLSVPGDAQVNSGTFSAAVWVKQTSETAEFSGILTSVVRGDSNTGALLRHSTATKKYQVVVYRGIGTSGFSAASTDAYPADGVWRHLAATYNGATLTLFVNGVAQATTGSGTGAFADASPFMLGRLYTDLGAYSWKGSLSGVRLYNRALTAAEVYALYTRPKVPLHAASHAEGEDDEITPADIGAMPTIPGATEDHFATFDADGNAQDSGLDENDFAGATHDHDDDYQALVPTATENNLATFDASGQVQDSGVAVGAIQSMDWEEADEYEGAEGEVAVITDYQGMSFWLMG